MKRVFRRWRLTCAALSCALAIESAGAHQLVLTTGYANSREPQTGSSIDASHPLFRAGGGYAAGIRVDLEPPRVPILFGPSFLFWNNLTGDPDPNANASYFQIELGGRVAFRTRTVPTFYAGAGVGYTVSHGEVVAKVSGAKQDFDGNFPTALLQVGTKTRSTEGLNLLAEIAFQFGLDDPPGHEAVGPASVWMIQIGVALDLLAGSP